MSRKNLSGQRLVGADLRGSDLEGGDLTGADLTDADLTGANLAAADLRGATLTRTVVAGANLHRAHIEVCYAATLKGYHGVPDWAPIGAKSGPTDRPGKWTVAERLIVCPHCDGDEFRLREILLNTRGMTFFKFDWLNDDASVLECARCSRLEWFARRPAPAKNEP